MTDRFNRTLLTTLALVLVVSGLVGVALNRGWLQRWAASQRLRPALEPSETYAQLSTAVTSRPTLWWPVILLAVVALGLLGLWWALRQVPRPGPPVARTTVATGARGATRLETTAVERALAADLRRLAGVVASAVRMIDGGAVPRLVVALDLAGGADQHRVRDAAEDCYHRLATAIGREQVAVDTTVRLDRAPATRVA